MPHYTARPITSLTTLKEVVQRLGQTGWVKRLGRTNGRYRLRLKPEQRSPGLASV
jgi:hypothetical protein